MSQYTKEDLEELHALLINLGTIFRDVCDENGIWYSLAFGTMLGAVREKHIIDWDTDIDVYILIEDKEKLRQAFAKRKYDDIELINYDTTKKCLKSHDVLVFNGSTKFRDVHLDIYPIVGAPSSLNEQNKIARLWDYQDRIIRSKYVDIRDSKRKVLVFFAKIIDFFIPDKILRKNIIKRETKYDMKQTGYWMTLVNYGAGRSCFPIEFLDDYEMKEMNGEIFKIMKGWDKYLTIVYGNYMKPKKY